MTFSLRNPRLIVVRMPPLGLSGPDVAATGFGWHFEELGGFLEVQGYIDGPPVGSIFMDAASGPAGAGGFLMALLQRRRTGRGSVVEVAQVENMTVHIGDVIMEAAMTGMCPPRRGNRTPEAAPQGVYPCAGDDQWLAISVGDLRPPVGDARSRWPWRPTRPCGGPSWPTGQGGPSRPTTRSTPPSPRGRRRGPRRICSTICRAKGWWPVRYSTRPTPPPTPTLRGRAPGFSLPSGTPPGSGGGFTFILEPILHPPGATPTRIWRGGPGARTGQRVRLPGDPRRGR